MEKSRKNKSVIVDNERKVYFNFMRHLVFSYSEATRNGAKAEVLKNTISGMLGGTNWELSSELNFKVNVDCLDGSTITGYFESFEKALQFKEEYQERAGDIVMSVEMNGIAA